MDVRVHPDDCSGPGFKLVLQLDHLKNGLTKNSTIHFILVNERSCFT